MTNLQLMNKQKQHDKLVRLAIKAEACTNREQALKLIKKADKAHRKLAE